MVETHGERYGNVAVLLHWAIAVLILTNVAIGLDFPHREPGQPFPAKPLLPLHVSIGLSVLILSVVRLLWRVAHRPPSHPSTMKQWEVLLANAAHVAFYVLIIALPVSGWAILSAHRNPKWQSLFGIPWPPLPIAGDLSKPAVEALHDAFVVMHSWLASMTTPTPCGNMRGHAIENR